MEHENYSSLSNPQILESLQNAEDNNQNLEEGSQRSSEAAVPERKWQWAFPQIEGVPPCPRGGHSATLTGASIIIFGGHYYKGKDKGYCYLNDTYVLDVNTNRWMKPRLAGTPPVARYKHTAMLAGTRIIVFGGKGEKQVFRDLHALDPVSMTWYQGPEGGGAPAARFGHSATFVGGSRMFVFGGWDGERFFDDLHILDLEMMAWSLPTSSGPAPTGRHGHCAVLIGSNLIIQGGFSSGEATKKESKTKYGSSLQACYLNDLRVLDTETLIWSRLRVTGTPPTPRFDHTLDVSGADLLMFGGWSFTSGSRVNDIKEDNCDYFMVLNTDSMSWQRGTYTSPPPTSRYGHTSTAIGPHLLIFGGWEFNRAVSEVIVLRDCSAGLEGSEAGSQGGILEASEEGRQEDEYSDA